MSVRSLFKHALSTCLCCFLLTISTIYSANAAVCFLPEGGNCSTGGDRNPPPIPCDTDCIYNDDKGEGWDCTQCSCTAGRWKCEKSTCPEGYSTDAQCNPDQTPICEGKSGSAQCCKCEDNSTRCQHEGYAYKKTTNNKCRNQCPYDSNYYEECWCENKYDLTATEKCYAYETCEVGDLANTKKYQKTNDLHKNCAEKGYVTKDSPQYTSNDYTCGATPICTECDDVEYYQCTPKHSCNASEGKYDTEELCVTAYRNSTQHASVLDWFEKVINNFSLIPTCYAANLDYEMCWHCRTAPNPRACYAECMPQTQVDGPSTDNPNTGCIAMAMEHDKDCVYCKTDDPTYRAPGCEGYPCCDITPTIPCRIDPDKNCALCSKGCDRKEYPCCLNNPEIVDPDPNPDVPESPCELKDGCWVVKTPNNTCNPDEGMYYTEAECKAAHNIAWNSSFTRMWAAVVNNLIPIKEAVAALPNVSVAIDSPSVVDTGSGYMISVGDKECPCPKTGPGSGQATGQYDANGHATYYDLSDCCRLLDNLDSSLGKFEDTLQETTGDEHTGLTYVCQYDNSKKCWYAVASSNCDDSFNLNQADYNLNITDPAVTCEFCGDKMKCSCARGTMEEHTYNGQKGLHCVGGGGSSGCNYSQPAMTVECYLKNSSTFSCSMTYQSECCKHIGGVTFKHGSSIVKTVGLTTSWEMPNTVIDTCFFSDYASPTDGEVGTTAWGNDGQGKYGCSITLNQADCPDNNATIRYSAPSNCDYVVRLTKGNVSYTMNNSTSPIHVSAGTYSINFPNQKPTYCLIGLTSGGTKTSMSGSSSASYNFAGGNDYTITPYCVAGAGCQNNSDCHGRSHTTCGIRWTACMEMTSNAYSYCMGQANQSSMMQSACNSMLGANQATCNNYKNYECMICQSGACVPDPVEPNWSSRLQHYSN